MTRPETDREYIKAILRAKLEVLMDLSDRVEEGDSWIDAWLELRMELLRKLSKLV